MGRIVADRVMEETTSTGTGDLTLAGAVVGFQAFADVCATSEIVGYAVFGVDASGVSTGEWETGVGTYSAANTLTRTTVQASSNANAAVSFAAGTKRVALSHIAGDYARGTTFPTTVAAGDRFFRTDRGIDYYFDGTRWLSVNMYLQTYDIQGEAYTNLEWPLPLGGVYDVWSVSLHLSGFVTSGSPASNYRSYVFTAFDGSGSTSVGTITSATFSASSIWSSVDLSTGVLIDKTNKIIYVAPSETGSSGSSRHRINHAMRLVG